MHLSAYTKTAFCCIIVYSLVQIYCINKLSINYDEGSFASYGISLLKGEAKKDIKTYDSKLPITAINMLPRAIEQLFSPHLKKSWPESNEDIIRGRYISLLVTLLLGLLILKWANELYGNSIALFIFGLYLLCPNFLAHGIFVSSDIFAALFTTSTFYYLWKFYQTNSNRHFLLMSLSCGLALISKFSMIHLPVIIILIVLIERFGQRFQNKPKISIRKSFLYIGFFIFLNWVILCSAHLFYNVFLPIKSYSFESIPLHQLQNIFSSVFPDFPIPLPSPYIQSMDAVMYFDKLGGGMPGSLNGPTYLLGTSSFNGFWYYYFVTIFYKVPISTFLIWITGLVSIVAGFKKKYFFSKEIFLIIPVLYFLIYLSFFYSTQLGIRHILIVFPMLSIISGKTFMHFQKRKRNLAFGFLLTYQAISVFLNFPHFLPYTNEFILNKKMAYKKLADTNLCYGEGQVFLNDYLIKNPDAIILPDKPVEGKVVMEVNELLDLNIATMHKYDWVKQLRPVSHIHSQYLIFDIDKHTADSLKTLYYP